jgi:hypothetical protein
MNAQETKVANKSKVHTVYKNAMGHRIPGTTTITGVMDKSGALVPWANRLGLQGIDCNKYRDEMATIGTLAHYMIECRLLGVNGDYSDYSGNQIEIATNSYNKFLQWEKSKGIMPTDYVVSEGKMVSEKYQFGGTIDLMAMVSNVPTLIDFKTCKAIYGEAKTQVAGGYRLLAEENAFGVQQIIILRIGRTDEEGFEEITIPIEESDFHVRRFKACLELYHCNKLIGR